MINTIYRTTYNGKVYEFSDKNECEEFVKFADIISNSVDVNVIARGLFLIKVHRIEGCNLSAFDILSRYVEMEHYPWISMDNFLNNNYDFNVEFEEYYIYRREDGELYTINKYHKFTTDVWYAIDKMTHYEK